MSFRFMASKETFLPLIKKMNSFNSCLSKSSSSMYLFHAFHDFGIGNQNLIRVMYCWSFFNASTTGTSSYFKWAIFGANPGRIFTNLPRPQTIDPRRSNEMILFQ